MDKIRIPQSYNYIGVFLTFSCNLRCSYCINHQYGRKQVHKKMTANEWIDGLNRIVTRPDLPITLQGGEPTLYKGIYKIIEHLDPSIPIDLLTNAQFDEDEFICNVDPARLRRVSPYASIRVSYHPETMDLEETRRKVHHLKDMGYSIGVWIVDHPDHKAQTQASMDIFLDDGIDCRWKEFLGEYKGKFYGTYKYPSAVGHEPCGEVRCRPSEMLIGPDGRIHVCHNSLYSNSVGYNSILAPEVHLLDEHVPCNRYGQCSSCDIKLKTNRFQEDGHCSVDIL